MSKNTRNSASICAALLIAATVGAGSSPASARSPQKDQELSSETRSLVRAAIASIGLVLVRNSADPRGLGPRPRGSAVVIRANGIVATNYHVITNTGTGRPYDELLVSLPDAGSDSINSGKRYRLTPLLIDKQYDLALLAIENAEGTAAPKSLVFPTVEIADSRKLRLLEDIFIIGFPEKGGTSVTVNRGVVEGLDREGKWIKTDARIIHGNSGGAAVNSEGKLVGIPTKVVADEQPVDKNGDGITDDYKRFGAVGFLRPSYLLVEMLEKLDQMKAGAPQSAAPEGIETGALVSVRGLVKSAVNGSPIAGALVGLLPSGAQNVSESNLLTWGSSDAQGEFKLNRAVPAGRYLLRAKALGSQPYTREVEIKRDSPPLIVEIPALRDK